MTDWLSSTWEANWRSFQYFNLYRLVLAALFFLALLFPTEWTARLNLLPSWPMFALTAAYTAAAVGGLVLATHWQRHFDSQLSAQVMVDIVVVCSLMLQAGGVGSGLSVLLIVSLAAASLVGRGRLVLFYAATATVAVLSMQTYGIIADRFEYSTIVQAGLISAGFFATAILARLLGQRVMVNEDLARRRGIALANQILISLRVIERMQDGVLILSKDGVLNRSNPVAQGMLGLPPIDAPITLASVSPGLGDALAARASPAAQLMASSRASSAPGPTVAPMAFNTGTFDSASTPKPMMVDTLARASEARAVVRGSAAPPGCETRWLKKRA